MNCEHKEREIVFYTGGLAVGHCVACWESLVFINDKEGLTYTFTPAEILAMRNEIAAARLVIDALLNDKPRVYGQSTVEAGLRWLGVTR